MKITVVYGGRGLIEDSTLYVLEKMQMVLEELRVEVERINLYEQKNIISTLPANLKDSDGLILAVSLEWFGIGGYMQDFLDSCWLYGDKEKIQSIYMMPVVIATTSGEKDAQVSLQKAWEILGGIPTEGLCAYVENHVDFEMNKDYAKLIEKKTEDLYRVINQRRVSLPSSTGVIRNQVLKTQVLDLTPQESEQLSKIVSDDTYVKQQKEDIEELSFMFKDMLKKEEEEEKQEKRKRVIAAVKEESANRAMDDKAEDDLISSLRDIARNVTAEPASVLDTRNQAPKTASIKTQAIPKDFKERFRQNFYPEADFSAVFILNIQDKDQIMRISVDVNELDISYVNKEEGDVLLRVNSSVLNRITIGEITFQRAFMGGDIKVKGNFKTLRMLDQIFRFS